MTNMADQKIKGSDNNFLFIDSNGLLVLRFRLLHDLDVKRINLDADFGPNGNHLRGLYQPFKAICHNFHLIMNTLEDRVDQGTLEDAFLRRYQLHILGTDDNIYGLVLTETGIYTIKTGTQDFYQTISDHGGTDDITVTDKISNESIFRFIIDALRSTDLLDITLVHDYDGIGHGQSLLLIVGHIDKGDANLLLTDPEHVLESGIEIQVAPPGKVIKNLISLSGGEQTFVAIAIYFAILKLRPAPFCILDEIDAALDEGNVRKYAQYLSHFVDTTQFILVTHRRSAMEEANVLYGVTMQEDGISKLLRMEQDTFESLTEPGLVPHAERQE